MVELLILVIVVFVLSQSATGLVRRYALNRGLLDRPNSRSSHDTATPRGGGLGLVAAYSVGTVLLLLLGQPATPLLLPVLAAAMLVATIGFLDDHSHIAPIYRLTIHLLATGWVTWWLMPEVSLLWAAITAIGLAWFLNLYNFMDGIDGIAAGEAAFLSAAVGLLSGLAGDWQMLAFSLLIASASGGFLKWNWPPAKIFLGDVGSGFLGLLIGALLLYAAVTTENPWPWIILPAVFVVDSTLTLTRRVIRGDRFYEAHRSHAYQLAARRWGHKHTTLAILLIDVVVLLPAALMVSLTPTTGPAVTLFIYIAAAGLALRLGAGRAS